MREELSNDGMCYFESNVFRDNEGLKILKNKTNRMGLIFSSVILIDESMILIGAFLQNRNGFIGEVIGKSDRRAS